MGNDLFISHYSLSRTPPPLYTPFTCLLLTAYALFVVVSPRCFVLVILVLLLVS